ncbi:MAG TPA: hypothetical protein VL899_12680 [Alphaproteobacteria bacterium]|nr:hypothetical protein [Alphaproteobacteria bacterium]
MISSRFGTRRKTLLLGVAAVAAVALCTKPAEAYGWYGGWHGGWGWRGWGPTVGIGIGFYPGYVYAPPVYYAPAPAYYYAPPAYYGPSYYSSSSYRYSTTHKTVRHRTHKTTTQQNCAPTQTAGNY